MPGIVIERLVHLRDQLFLGDLAPPLRLRFQIDEELRHVDRLRIGAVLGPAGLAKSPTRPPGTAQQSARTRAQLPRGLADGDARRQREVDPDVAFVQLRQEFACRAAAPARGCREQRPRPRARPRRPRAARPAAPADRARLHERDEQVLFVAARPCRSRNKHSSGTSVSENSSEPISAETIVYAIGAKMRPSWRCSVKIGMCAMMMISIEKNVGRPTSDGGFEDRSLHRHASRGRARSCQVRGRHSRRTMTAPSTMMPKSIAPSDSRFAGMPRIVRPMNVASSDSGIITATIAGRAEVAQEEIQHDASPAARPRAGS